MQIKINCNDSIKLNPIIKLIIFNILIILNINKANDLSEYKNVNFTLKFKNSDIRIIDADTIELKGKKARLTGIDAPENDQICIKKDGTYIPCGIQSTEFLKNLIGTSAIFCEISGKDIYKRLLTVCYKRLESGNFLNINESLVENGYAFVYYDYSKAFCKSQKIAFNKKRGIWSHQSFLYPWDYRKFTRGKKKISIINDKYSYKNIDHVYILHNKLCL